MHYLAEFVGAFWNILMESSLYILLGLLVAGLLHAFLPPALVAGHLGRGRYGSVFKAALLGVPIPLCSCGVLPVAAQLKRQGANNGAVIAFLISTPESGADSIALSWALLDPIMTVVRPVAAFISAFAAGIFENRFGTSEQVKTPVFLPMALAAAPSICGADGCSCHQHGHEHDTQTTGAVSSLRAGIRYAIFDIWGDLMGWFFVGVLVATVITVAVPDNFINHYLNGGIGSMLVMLAVGIPMYICATASTPIAAAMILKGVSPGAALVFLMAGPATNMTSITMLSHIVGKRGLAIYLGSVAVVSVLCGLGLDALYGALGMSAVASIGRVNQELPFWLLLTATLVLLALSVFHLYKVWAAGSNHHHHSEECA